MKKRLTVGIIFGGRSGEHEVSLVSATSIITALDKNKYEVVEIGIAKDGRWFSGETVLADLKNGRIPSPENEAVILPDPFYRGLFFVKSGRVHALDVVFPVLHGPFGEDGTVQGLFELANIPYVGAGVAGSAIGMDKILQKEVVRQVGINTAPSVWFYSTDFGSNKEDWIKKIESSFDYPYFIKPSNSGSSVGIAKAHNKKELLAAIGDAVRYDTRILVEKGIEGAREIEASVLGNEKITVSSPGEVIPSNEFYDYDAKYVDGKSKTIVPADLPQKTITELKAIAEKAYQALNLNGMARVDFLVTKDAIFFNEVNTIPGFTSISMYPKLFEASGISYSELLDRLVELALERFAARSRLLTSYQPKKAWFK